MVDLVYCPAILLFFDLLILHYHINLNFSIFYCLSSGDIHIHPIYVYIYIYIYIIYDIHPFSACVLISELFLGELFETFVILPAILLST